MQHFRLHTIKIRPYHSCSLEKFSANMGAIKIESRMRVAAASSIPVRNFTNTAAQCRMTIQ